MAEERQVTYQNIKGLKALTEEFDLPSLKKEVFETKKEIASILTQLKGRDKELVKIKQEQRQRDAEEIGGESQAYHAARSEGELNAAREEKPVSPVVKDDQSAAKQTKPQPEIAPKADAEQPKKAERADAEPQTKHEEVKREIASEQPAEVKAEAPKVEAPKAETDQPKKPFVKDYVPGGHIKERQNRNNEQGDRPSYNNREGGHQGNREGENNNNNRPSDRPQYNNNNREGGYQGNRPSGSYGDRPQYNNNNREGGYQGNRPSGSGGDRPQYNNNNREGGYQGNRPSGSSGDRPQYNNNQGGYQGNRPSGNSGDRPQYNNNQGGYQGNRPSGSSGDRPQYNNNQGGYNNNRPSGSYGDRPQYNNNQGGYQGNRPSGTGGDRPQYNNNQGGYQGNRPAGNYGDRPQYNNNRQGGQGYQGARPAGNRPGGILPKPEMSIAPLVKKEQKDFSANKKKEPAKKVEEKTLNKKALIQRGFVDVYTNEDRMGSKKLKSKKKKELILLNAIKIEHAVVNSEIIPLKVLSDKLGITAVEITKKLFKEGIIKTINDALDFDTAAYIASEIGITLELKLDKTAEETMLETFVSEQEEDNSNLTERPPIVTVMGHVDHGKTSLLDCIRKTNVTSGEAGGITQHIGAYTIKVGKRDITFIDTPGHEAFTAMRKRGADVTDIAILVVAADDGVMPQTIEAINHAKAAGVPMIVAINKMDKPTANVDKIKQQLADQSVLCEEWGGDVIMAPVSAHTREGVDSLLEMILLVADVKELKANPNRQAKGTIIEAKLDKGKGPVASIIVQNGTLNVGDIVVAGTATGKIRAMIDDKGRNVKSAGPSFAVSVLGFSDVPQAGDELHVVSDEKTSKQVADERRTKLKEKTQVSGIAVTLDDVFSKITEGQMKGLNIIVKADVQGSVEAVKQSLLKLTNEEVKVNVIHGGVGAVSETDVMLASTSSAIIIAFNVRPDVNAKQIAERDGVDIRTYRVIYDAINDIGAALKGMLAPKFKEVVLGQAEVRETFKVSSVGTIAGCYVLSGKITRASSVRVLRDNVVVFEGKLSTLKRFKDDAKEVASGYECGVTIDNFNDIKQADILEAFVMEQI